MSSARESKEGSILTGHMETYNNSSERVAQKGYSDLLSHPLFLQHYDFFEQLTELESILGGSIPTVQRIKCLEAALSISATPGASLHEHVGTLEFHAWAEQLVDFDDIEKTAKLHMHIQHMECIINTRCTVNDHICSLEMSSKIEVSQRTTHK